jgi:hypothetical protein
VSFGHKAEERAVTIKTPWDSGSGNLQRGFPVAKEQFASQFAGGVSVNELDNFRPVPFDINNGH